MFDELQLHFAVITESWLKDGDMLDRDVIDLEYGTDLKILYKNRPVRAARARKVGGGVSIIYSKSRCSFRERRIASKNFEIIMATGKVTGIDRSLMIIAVYIEPTMRVAALGELRELISDQVLKAKSSSNGEGPLIYVGGDLNRRDLGPAFDVFNDISRINHEPTRLDACLDVVYGNFEASYQKVFPPLESSAGAKSDHACVVIFSKIENARNFKWVRKTARKHTQAACDNFALRILGTDWEELLGGRDVDDMVEIYEKFTTDLVDELFPLKTVRMRDNEPPWITDGIRALARRKRRAYKRRAKSNHWKALQSKLTALVERSRAEYVDKIESGPNNSRSYFQAIKALKCREKPPEWDVASLFSDLPPREAGGKIAEFYTKITDQYTPLEAGDLPPLVPRRPLTEDEVASKMAAAKKPSSQVEGDILPRLMKAHHAKLVKPATMMFNAALAAGRWPSRWRRETAVIIPKVAAPASLSECRNISCTNFLSKVLEMFLLEDLRSEVEEDLTQYGGIKGVSVNHLLVDIWDSILRPLDGGEHAIVLGIDYEKAFNRLDHRECLAQLEALGASPSTIRMIASFLTGRTVRVKMSCGTMSEPLPLNGGSPQGCILGGILYCITTQQIGTNLILHQTAGTAVPPPSPPSPTPSSEGNTEEIGFNLMGDLSPPASSPEPPVAANDSADEQASPVPTPGSDQGEASNIVVFKYIDDTTSVESVHGDRAIKHFSARGPTESIPALETDSFINGVIERAEDIGMRVNCAKTQLLVVSLDNGCKSTAMIKAGSTHIASGDSLKLLGFMFGSEPGMSEHFALIRRKFRGRFWSLIHLKVAGIKGLKLYRLYTVFIRPVIECNSVIYSSMLTVHQSDEIEKMQKKVAKLCFGFDRSYDELIAAYGLQKLSDRRKTATERFVVKAMANPRFRNKWFKPRQAIENDLRTRRPFVEDKARTTRFMKSPLLTMQKIANDIATR